MAPASAAQVCSIPASCICLSSLVDWLLEADLFLSLLSPSPPPGSCFNLSVAEMQSTQRAYFYRRFPILHLESGDGLPAVASLCGLPRTVHVSVSFSLPHGPSCLPVPVPCAALGSCPPQCAWHGPQWNARFLRDCVGMFHMEGKPLKPGVLLRAPPGDCVFCLDSCASCMRFRCLCYCVSVAEGQLCDPSALTQRALAL